MLVNPNRFFFLIWSGENSRNHQMFGSVTEYFYKFLAGIQSRMEGNTTKGYRQIHIEPNVPQDLDFVYASVETVAGKVVSNWKKEDGSFIHEVTIPANTNGTVALPLNGSENVTVYEGDSKIWENNAYVEGVSGIHKITKENDRLVVKIGSGKYRFRVE